MGYLLSCCALLDCDCNSWTVSGQNAHEKQLLKQSLISTQHVCHAWYVNAASAEAMSQVCISCNTCISVALPSQWMHSIRADTQLQMRMPQRSVAMSQYRHKPINNSSSSSSSSICNNSTKGNDTHSDNSNTRCWVRPPLGSLVYYQASRRTNAERCSLFFSSLGCDHASGQQGSSVMCDVLAGCRSQGEVAGGEGGGQLPDA